MVVSPLQTALTAGYLSKTHPRSCKMFTAKACSMAEIQGGQPIGHQKLSFCLGPGLIWTLLSLLPTVFVGPFSKRTICPGALEHPFVMFHHFSSSGISSSQLTTSYSGWWFRCHFLFSHILGIIIPID